MVARKRPSQAGATLRTADGDRIEIAGGPDLDRTALAWSYIARHRVRFQGSRAASEDLAERCATALEGLGVDADALTRLAERPPDRGERPGALRLGPRIMPWELLLGQAIATRSATPSLIVRHLACRTSPQRRRRGTQGGRRARRRPGRPDDVYTFDTERIVSRQALGGKAVLIEDPTPATLKRRIAATSPDVIHVGGLDVHQGTDYFDLGEIERFDDGMVLVDERGHPVAVPASTLARTLTVRAAQEAGARRIQSLLLRGPHRGPHGRRRGRRGGRVPGPVQRSRRRVVPRRALSRLAGLVRRSAGVVLRRVESAGRCRDTRRNRHRDVERTPARDGRHRGRRPEGGRRATRARSQAEPREDRAERA